MLANGRLPLSELVALGATGRLGGGVLALQVIVALPGQCDPHLGLLALAHRRRKRLCLRLEPRLKLGQGLVLLHFRVLGLRQRRTGGPLLRLGLRQ